MPQRMPNIPEWGFVSGRISALETYFLTREFFTSLIAQEHIDDIVQHLQGTFLADYLTPGTVWEDFSALADRCFHDMAVSIRSDCPSTIPADIFLLQNDYLNLRNAFSGGTTFPFLTGTLSHERLLEIAHGDFANLPEPVTESGEFGGGEICEVFPGVIDTFLDGAYLRHILGLGQASGSEMIGRYVNDKVLASIVTILWRAVKQGIQTKRFQQYLLPLGDSAFVTELVGMQNPETWQTVIEGTIGDIFADSMELEPGDRIAGFELRVANHLTGIARDGKYQTAGPERVFSFLSGFLVEMQNLKLVVTGRLNRIDQGLLRQRLKDCYV